MDTIYGRAMQMFNNEQAAALFTKNAMLEKTQATLASNAYSAQATKAPQQAQLINAELERAKLSTKQQLQQQGQQTALLRSLGGINELAKKSPLELQAMGLPKELVQAAGQQRELTVPGTSVIMPDKEARGKLEKDIGDAAIASQQLGELYSMINDPSWSKYSPEDRALAGQKVESLVGRLREQIVGPGVMNADEYKRILGVIGNPKEITTLQSDATKKKMILALKNTLESAVNQKIKFYGGQGSFINKPQIQTVQPK
jgi:hypothetical protein